MTTEQNTHLDALLAAWREHEENKDRCANFDELLDSRDRLAVARRAARHTVALAS